MSESADYGLSFADQTAALRIKTWLEARGVQVGIQTDSEDVKNAKVVVAIVGHTFTSNLVYQSHIRSLIESNTSTILVIASGDSIAWPEHLAGLEKKTIGPVNISKLDFNSQYYFEAMTQLLDHINKEKSFVLAPRIHSLDVQRDALDGDGEKEGSSEVPNAQDEGGAAFDAPLLLPPIPDFQFSSSATNTSYTPGTPPISSVTENIVIDYTMSSSNETVSRLSSNSSANGDTDTRRLSFISVQSFNDDTDDIVEPSSQDSELLNSTSPLPSNVPSPAISPLLKRSLTHRNTLDSPGITRWAAIKGKNELTESSLSNALEPSAEPTSPEETVGDAEAKYNETVKIFESKNPIDPSNHRTSTIADLRRGVSLLKQAAELGHAKAICRLGRLHESGVPGLLPMDREAAIKAYQSASDAGDAEAMARYGRFFEQGVPSLPRNARLALDLYMKSAEANDPLGLYFLGRCHENGLVDEDGTVLVQSGSFNQAYAYYRRSADLGDHHGLESAGFCLQHGFGVAKDVKAAVAMYKKSADMESPAGQFSLAECYRAGIGIPSEPSSNFLNVMSAASGPKLSAAEVDRARGAVMAIALYEASAAQGFAPAFSTLGYCHFHGIGGLEKDQQKAVSLYREASSRGDADGRYRLAFCLLHGIGRNKDPQGGEVGLDAIRAAMRLLRLASDQGDLNAQTLLARCLENPGLFPSSLQGDGSTLPAGETHLLYSPEEAVNLYQTAASRGQKEALIRYARCLEIGSGVRPDIAKAIGIYRAQSESGYELGQYFLAKLLEIGAKDHFARDTMAAVKLYQKGCEKNLPESLHRLGEMLRDGQSPVKKDPGRAFRLFERAAGVTRGRDTGAGYSPAQRDLALLLEIGSGTYSIPKDIKKAFELFYRAAEAGDANAQYHVARCFRYGIGVARNDAQAIAWLYRAIDRPDGANIEARVLLGDMFRDGFGVARDQSMAHKHYRIAASDGKHAGAKTRLGALFECGRVEDGKGYRRGDYDTVTAIYTQAAEKGDPNAMYRLGLLHENGWISRSSRGEDEASDYKPGTHPPRTDGDPLKAIDWYKKAAGAGDHQAILRLGDCYRDGIGFEMDWGQAAFRYKEALDIYMADDVKGLRVRMEGLEAATRIAMLHLMPYLGTVEDPWVASERNPMIGLGMLVRNTELGDASALNALGDLHRTGCASPLVSYDPVRAFKLYERAVNAGSLYLPAVVNFGLCFEQGIGVRPEPNRAFIIYRDAAERGSPAGMGNLARCFQHGIGVWKNPRIALDLYIAASDMGDPGAMYALGLWHTTGSEEEKSLPPPPHMAPPGHLAPAQAPPPPPPSVKVVCDYRVAHAWFRRASARNNAAAKNAIGYYYEEGLAGLAKDGRQASEMYRKAALLGDSAGIFNYGVCFERGVGVRVDNQKAVEMYRRAAEMGHRKAQEYLQKFYGTK
ncbi:hypothetical protein HDU97_005865 [Phlyctochytrium planicorne]|nr:hypothetical protein HDU97_005865 [Phlyctochytrium planicorne]